MRTRGRLSADALAVITPSGVQSMRRPPAPDNLSADEADEWRAVVNRLPADWFPRETHGMLAQFCRHVLAAQRIADMIRTLEAEIASEAAERGASAAVALLGAMKGLDQLFKMQERESRAMAAMATKMRISQQTQYDPRRKRGSQTRKPWESE